MTCLSPLCTYPPLSNNKLMLLWKKKQKTENSSLFLSGPFSFGVLHPHQRQRPNTALHSDLICVLTRTIYLPYCLGDVRRREGGGTNG